MWSTQIQETEALIVAMDEAYASGKWKADEFTFRLEDKTTKYDEMIEWTVSTLLDCMEILGDAEFVQKYRSWRDTDALFHSYKSPREISYQIVVKHASEKHGLVVWHWISIDDPVEWVHQQ